MKSDRSVMPQTFGQQGKLNNITMNFKISTNNKLNNIEQFLLLTISLLKKISNSLNLNYEVTRNFRRDSRVYKKKEDILQSLTRRKKKKIGRSESMKLDGVVKLIN